MHWGVDNPLTKMVVDLKRLNPDDSYSVVPYEKGYTFLVYLERLLGGPGLLYILHKVISLKLGTYILRKVPTLISN